MKVADWMTCEVETIVATETLAVATEKMQQRGCRRLPVVGDDGLLTGIVTERDLREHKGFLERTKVAGVMVEEALTVGPDTSIEEAADLMLQRQIGGVPVVESDRQLVGIITTTDLVRGLVRMLRDGEGTA